MPIANEDHDSNAKHCFNCLKNARRLAPRYDKTATSHLGFIGTISARLRVAQNNGISA